MPNTPNNNLVPGQPFPHSAKFWNPVIEASRSHRDSSNPSPSSNPGVLAASRAIIVLVKNTTGSAVGRNCPLKIDGVVISPTDNELSFRDAPIFIGIAPTDDSVHKLVLTIEPIANGEIGRAIISGAAIATINVSDTAHQFARPAASNTANLVSATDGFPVLYAANATGLSVAAVLLSGCDCGSSSTGSGGGGSCCCPDGAYKLGYPEDYATNFPTGITTDQKTAFHLFTQDYVYSGVTYQRKFEILSEISESIMKDGFVLRERIAITFSQTGPQHPFFYGIGPQYWWPSDDGLTADGWELVQVPDLWTKVHRAAYKEVSPGGGPHTVASNPAYKINNGIFDDTGTDTLVLEFTVRSNDVSDLMQYGRIGLDFGDGTINRFFLPCVGGEPDTTASSTGLPSEGTV